LDLRLPNSVDLLAWVSPGLVVWKIVYWLLKFAVLVVRTLISFNGHLLQWGLTGLFTLVCIWRFISFCGSFTSEGAVPLSTNQVGSNSESFETGNVHQSFQSFEPIHVKPYVNLNVGPAISTGGLTSAGAVLLWRAFSSRNQRQLQ